MLFDETQAELEALRARAGEVSAEMQRAENTENLLRRLGNLRLSYIQLEREFLAKDGAKELWPSQTKLHNTAAGIIDLELGRDYWSDFKDVKSSPPESVIPKSFPRDDHEVMNLLYMIHGRSEWIGKIVQGIRAGSVVPKRLPVETGPPDSQRVTDMRALLREAAAHVSAMPKKLGDSRSAAEMAFMVMETIPELLNRAFLSPPTENFKSFMSAERDKQGDNPDPGIAAAAFLNRLADSLTGDNLDEGFLMPQSFEQFVAADSGRSS